jgi:hypothetical protein
MAYHVIYPSQPSRAQVENVERIFDKVGGDTGEGPVWIDWELYQDVPPDLQTMRAWYFYSGLVDGLGLRSGFYSGDWFLSRYAVPASWWAEVDWWLAHYLKNAEHPGPPAHPKAIPEDRVIIHQSGSRFDGRRIGVSSADVDGNRYMGKAPLRVYLGLDDPDEMPDPEGHIIPAVVASLDAIIAEATAAKQALMEV